MSYQITLSSGKVLVAEQNENLLRVLRRAGAHVPAYCGGQSTCGKCEVLVNGTRRLACSVSVEADLQIEIPAEAKAVVLTDDAARMSFDVKNTEDLILSVDIGTTTIAAYLSREDGTVLASEGCLNPQGDYGADVVTRLRFAREHGEKELTDAARQTVKELFDKLLDRAGAYYPQVRTICVVGNPAMQQLLLGMPVDNLVTIPYLPVITKGEEQKASEIWPQVIRASHRVVPDIGAYVGADTVSAAIAQDMDKKEHPTLLVDIGTNGEMMLSCGGRLYACATAAGAAFEGANIHFGMRAAEGAIDHVSVTKTPDGTPLPRCHVIGDTKAVGICGSGLMDAVSVYLDLGMLDKRGRILRPDHILPLTDQVWLTQEDVRALQTAKGAVAGGIALLIKEAGIKEEDVREIIMAGAFGSFILKESACRIGLLPEGLVERVHSVGNAAGIGSVILASSEEAWQRADRIASGTHLVELGSHPDFDRLFAKNMYFRV